MPPLYKNLFILKFEKGNWLDSKIYILKKISVHLEGCALAVPIDSRCPTFALGQLEIS